MTLKPLTKKAILKQIKKGDRVPSSRSIIMDMLSTMKKTGRFTAQPVHTPLDAEVVGNENLIQYLVRNAMDVINTWDVDYVIADKKYKGVRVIMEADPTTGDFQIYSRNAKTETYEKFRDKYRERFLKDLERMGIKGAIILDGEMLLQEKGLPQGDITGYIRNPEGKPNYKPLFRVFDILYYNGVDMREYPLQLRREILETLIDKRGVIKPVEYFIVKTGDLKALERAFVKSIKDSEGLVIKDPTQPYIQQKGGDLNWLKLKIFETPDFELKRVEAHPRGKPFRFYKHWVVVPSDNEEHEISADKGFDGLGFDWDFYKQFTLNVLEQVEKGEAIPSEETVKVDPAFIPIYGRTEVPKSVTFPNKNKRLIVELLVDDISKNLIPTGQKILGIRYDKTRGDPMKKLELIRKMLILKEELNKGEKHGKKKKRKKKKK